MRMGLRHILRTMYINSANMRGVPEWLPYLRCQHTHDLYQVRATGATIVDNKCKCPNDAFYNNEKACKKCASGCLECNKSGCTKCKAGFNEPILGGCRRAVQCVVRALRSLYDSGNAVTKE